MGKIFACIFLLFAVPAMGEPLGLFGWSLTKIPQEQEDPDGTYTFRPDFYSLKPPGDRPAVTVDSRTAASLRNGQLQPDEAYNRRTKTAEAGEGSEDEEFVYSAANSGIVQAEVVSSTLPSDQRPAGEVVSLPRETEPAPIASPPGFAGAGATSPRPPLSSPPVSNGSFSSSASSAASRAPASQPAPPQFPEAQPAAVGRALPERPGVPEKTEADLNFSSAVSAAAAANVRVGAGGSEASDQVAKPTDGGSGFGLAANSTAQGFGFSGSGRQPGSQTGTRFEQPQYHPSASTSEGGGSAPPPPCSAETKVFDKPDHIRLDLPPGCNLVYVTAWGAGGGMGGSGGASVSGHYFGSGQGAGGAFVNTTGKVDARKYDLVIVVGAAGASASGTRGGLGGFPGGGTGGDSSNAPGGGGGGFSGVFLIEKSNKTKNLDPEKALAVAAGGGGGSGRGGNGQPGNIAGAGSRSGNGEDGRSLLGGHGGAGFVYPGCERSKGNCTIGGGDDGYQIVPEDYDSAGGGGGGGGLIGGGGGGGAGSGGNANGGGGGSSVAKLDNTITEAGSGIKAGFFHYPERGNAGNAGQHGKVILQYY
jgi:hypothetical protein